MQGTVTSGTDIITLVSTVASAVAAIMAFAAVLLSLRERQSNMKEDFVLWAIERLREPDMRDSRQLIYSLTPTDWEDLEKAARENRDDPRLDQIRRVCLSFDEIGYFVYKVGLVNFRDILDMYPQTIKIWNKVTRIIKAWRSLQNPSSFVYFEMLARQEVLTMDPRFDTPEKLYPGQSVNP